VRNTVTKFLMNLYFEPENSASCDVALRDKLLYFSLQEW